MATALRPWHEHPGNVEALLTWLRSSGADEIDHQRTVRGRAGLASIDTDADEQSLRQDPWKYGSEWLAFNEWKAIQISEAAL